MSELALTQGIDTFILAASSGDDLRRFAAEVAPAARELVGRERGRADQPRDDLLVASGTSGPATAAPPAVQATPDDAPRLSAEQPWDESTRPTAGAPGGKRRCTPDQQAAGRHLVDIHDGLRGELARIRDLLEQVGRGTADPRAVRSLLNRTTLRQNNWPLGIYCQSYCRILTGHHTLEKEHEVIAGLLERVDEALIALVSSDEDALEYVRGAMDVLTDALLSHFAYEERELIEPLARFGYS